MTKQTSTITVQCVYNKKHKKEIDADTADFPLCEHDGGPMIVVKATIKTKR